MKYPYRSITLNGYLILRPGNVVQYEGTFGVIFESHLKELIQNPTEWKSSLDYVCDLNGEEHVHEIEFKGFYEIVKRHWIDTVCPVEAINW